jgi:hypothetical protein
MKRLSFIPLCFLIGLFWLTGCDRLDGLDEGDRNTYTWRGTLCKVYSDEVEPIYLTFS